MTKEKRTTDVIQVEERPFGTPFVLALAAFSGPDRHAVYRIVSEETTVGRSLEADFTIKDSKVSNEHIRIRVNGTLFSLIDLGSTNGTLLNQRRVTAKTPTRLKSYDEIQIGRTKLLFIANRFRESVP